MTIPEAFLLRADELIEGSPSNRPSRR